MYYKKSHHAWYVNVKGKPVRLGKTEAEATTALACLTGGGLETVGEAVDKFMSQDLSDGNRQFYIQAFKTLQRELRIADLKPYHVKGSRNTMRATKTCFKWCAEQGYINTSPLKDMRLPTATGRGDDVYLTDEQMQQLYACCPDDLYDVLVALHETGCRPSEVRHVTAKNLSSMCWTFVRGKGGRPRVVHLSARVNDICRRLALRYHTGPLFRNARGGRWTAAALVGRFARLSDRVGFPVTAYYLRHTFITNALERGVDPVTLATLVGHTDLKMIHKHYAHLQRRSKHLAAAVAKVVA
jgi:integrase